jgi:hypothetical protein
MTLEERALNIVERLQDPTDDFNVDDVLVALRYAQAEAYAKAASVLDPPNEEPLSEEARLVKRVRLTFAEAIRNLASDGDKP